MQEQHADPEFFQYFNRFIEALPNTPSSNSGIHKADADIQQHPLLKNYLRHYTIELVAEEIASDYAIWKTTIAQYRIVEHVWQPIKPNGQILFLVHGYFDHCGLYGKLIRWALQRGYTVHGFDLPGHGLSSGEPAAISHFDEYSHVLTHILKRENYSNYCLVGQSTGCAAIINTMMHSQFSDAISHTPQKVVMLAPLIRIFHWPQLRYLYFTLRPIIKTIKRAFVESSHDKHFSRFLQYQEPLQATRIPLSWIGAMEMWVEHVKQLTPINSKWGTIETAIIQGSGDRTVDWHYNHPQIKNCMPQTTTDIIKDAGHQLVNESPSYWFHITKALEKVL